MGMCGTANTRVLPTLEAFKDFKGGAVVKKAPNRFDLLSRNLGRLCLRSPDGRMLSWAALKFTSMEYGRREPGPSSELWVLR